jgi:hypothetical protein
MLTPDQIERCNALWRRLYARGAVRWMPGMRYASDSHRSDGFERVPERHEQSAFSDWLYSHPDFNDPATLGCLLAMAREATGDARLHVEWPDALQGNCYACGDSGYGEEDCEPAALLQAIEESTNAK